MKLDINKGMILSVASNSDVYERGESYFSNGKVKETICRRESDIKIGRAIVSGNYKDYEVLLTFDRADKLKSYKCTCESHSIWRGACKHVVAAMFAMMINNPAEMEQARISAAAKEVADAFQKQIFDEIDDAYSVENDNGRIFLRPTIHISSGGQDILAEFTIGDSRAYTVKNISELLSNIRNSAVASYGKRLSFCHNFSVFDSQSKRLIKFLERENGIYNSITKSFLKRLGYYAYSRDNPRYITLSAHNMDDFFELCVDGAKLSLSIDRKAPGPVSCLDQIPDIRFDVDYQGDRVTLRGQPVDYFLLKGEKYSYVVIGEFIYRLTKRYAKMIAPIFKALKTLSGSIVFSDKEANRFMTLIYPALKKNNLLGNVTGKEYSVPSVEMRAKLYFDIVDRDICCKVLFCYEDDEINPLLPDKTIYPRDAAEEYRVIRILNSLGFGEDTERAVYYLRGDELIYEFLRTESDELNKVAEVYVSDELRKKEIKRTPRQFGLRITGNLLELSVENSDFSLIDLIEAVEAYNTKKKFHRLKDGRFIPLENDDVRAAAELVSSLDLSKKDVSRGVVKLPKYRALYLDSIMRDSENIIRDGNFNELIGGFNNYTDMDFPVPESLKRVLRSYQKTGFAWLAMLSHYGFGGILADDMGLGKTIQVITLLLSEKNSHGGKLRSLVVAPTSLIFNWDKEIGRFSPTLSTDVISGTAGHRHELLSNTVADVIITTYDMLKRDLDLYRAMEFDYIIADEAQYIKNPLTQNAKAIKAIKGRTRLALTGTPMENSLSELWSIFDFVMPGYLYTQNRFTKLYETPIIKDDDKTMAKRLQKHTAPFILRRIKKDVLKELPDKTETSLYAEMLPEQKKLYLATLLKARGELEQIMDEGLYSQSKIKILSHLTRLRQICCHPGLFSQNYSGGSGKLDLVIETVGRAVESGHRLLLFSQFTSMLGIIKESLDRHEITYFYLDGATKPKQRSELTERFNKGEHSCFLISLKAGGTGLNLTGADVVIHYDPWWNPAVMDQASDRAHRFGQQRAVQIFNLVAKDSIEEKILMLQNKKRDLIDSVITDGVNFINQMSPEDVRELFV